MEQMGCDLLHDLVQVRLGQAVGQPLHGGGDHGILRLPTPLQAAESGRGGLVGHGVAVVGLETENTTRKVMERA